MSAPVIESVPDWPLVFAVSAFVAFHVGGVVWLELKGVIQAMRDIDAIEREIRKEER